jgi:hypothetical protein
MSSPEESPIIPPSVPYKELNLAVTDADGETLTLQADHIEVVDVEIVYEPEEYDLLQRSLPRQEEPEEIIIRVRRPRNIKLTGVHI